MDSAPDYPDNPIVQFLRIWKWAIIAGAASVTAIGISIVLLVRAVQTPEPIEFSSQSLGAATGGQGIIVDVEGAVASPGAKSMPVGSRVEDAINAAGGFRDDADVDMAAKVLNRAQVLADGMKIYVPILNRRDDTSHNGGKYYGRDTTSYNIPKIVAGNQDQGLLVSINGATASELDILPGVGPATSAKIISARPYGSIEELVTKKVIGQTLFDKIKYRLSL